MIKLRNHFWNRRRREGLTDLRESHERNDKGTGSVVNFGDVVHVYNVVKGKDGIVRGASVRMVEKGAT